jgi:hypothetical protein
VPNGGPGRKSAMTNSNQNSNTDPMKLLEFCYHYSLDLGTDVLQVTPKNTLFARNVWINFFKTENVCPLSIYILPDQHEEWLKRYMAVNQEYLSNDEPDWEALANYKNVMSN